MQITHIQIPVRELIKDYKNDTTTGRVSGYGGKLDIRPSYQREFIYKDKQRDAVIETINKGFPLNVMYWAKIGEDKFEILDGQQRTISICQYCNDEYSINYRYYHNLTNHEKDTILDYKLDIYQCEGPTKEKLDWFQTINIAGEKLTNQELRNAVYAGTWLTDAKKKFSAKNCPAEKLAKDYLNGSAIRQEYLEKVLNWIASKESTSIEDYMAKHQLDINAGAIWSYFTSIITWVQTIYTTYRKEMKSVDWGLLYNQYNDQYPDSNEIESKIKTLMQDEDVTCKKGIYDYLLSNNEKALSIRAFSPNMKREAYERQEGICPYCHEQGDDTQWELEQMEADHITPWCEGGKTIAENCVMLCKKHNREKGKK